jgi:hypothetical protein
MKKIIKNVKIDFLNYEKYPTIYFGLDKFKIDNYNDEFHYTSIGKCRFNECEILIYHKNTGMGFIKKVKYETK